MSLFNATLNAAVVSAHRKWIHGRGIIGTSFLPLFFSQSYHSQMRLKSSDFFKCFFSLQPLFNQGQLRTSSHLELAPA